jgi:hypothetical protein
VKTESFYVCGKYTIAFCRQFGDRGPWAWFLERGPDTLDCCATLESAKNSAKSYAGITGPWVRVSSAAKRVAS